MLNFYGCTKEYRNLQKKVIKSGLSFHLHCKIMSSDDPERFDAMIRGIAQQCEGGIHEVWLLNINTVQYRYCPTPPSQVVHL